MPCSAITRKASSCSVWKQFRDTQPDTVQGETNKILKFKQRHHNLLYDTLTVNLYGREQNCNTYSCDQNPCVILFSTRCRDAYENNGLSELRVETFQRALKSAIIFSRIRRVRDHTSKIDDLGWGPSSAIECHIEVAQGDRWPPRRVERPDSTGTTPAAQRNTFGTLRQKLSGFCLQLKIILCHRTRYPDGTER